MEIKGSVKAAIAQLKKYRYAVMIIIAGIILMRIPPLNNYLDNTKSTTVVIEETPTLEEKLAETLSHLHGAGEVCVMLSIAEGERYIYQLNTDTTDQNENKSQRNTTVTVTDSSRNETGLIQQVIPTQYQGAIVLCTGADEPSVRLAIVDAVSKATGLGANHISVLKMK